MGKFITFDKGRYIAAMREMARNIQMSTMRQIAIAYRVNLMSNEFNRLDVKHMADMMASVSYNVYGQNNNFTLGTIGIGDSTIKNQYFRVVYYEYGTGQYISASAGYNPGNDPFRNPARKGDHRFYTWQENHRDLGGNERKGTGKKPRLINETRSDGKPNYYAQPIRPHFNLGRAVASSKEAVRDSLREEVRLMNPIAYTTLRGMKVRA